jgi:F-type H+-transporting ATPase subunit b
MVAPAPTDIQGETYATTTAGGYGEEASGGLPQFDTTVWVGQIVWLLILFAILYLLISKVFAPRLRRVMDERAATISGAVATARQVQAEAARQAEAAKAEVAAARSSARATAAAAAARIAEQAADRKAADEAAIGARIAEAEAAIGKTRDAAMTNVSAIAGETTAAIIERLTGRLASAAEVDAAVKGAA